MNDLSKLKVMRDIWRTESARVISWTTKMTKFDEKVNLRIIELEEIEEQVMIEEDQAVSKTLESFKVEDLEKFWLEKVEN